MTFRRPHCQGFRPFLASLAIVAAAVLPGTFQAAQAQVIQPITLQTFITGVGGANAKTNVLIADLSPYAGFGSITLIDKSLNSGTGGQYSGFDLDAIAVSPTDCRQVSTTAGKVLCVESLLGNTVNYSSMVFTPGTQFGTVEYKLFGTGATGHTVNSAMATLGSFDANSASIVSDRAGWLSMGRDGKLVVNLNSPTGTGMYLYLGEVGGNGESLNAFLTSPVPEPKAYALMLMGLGLVGAIARRRHAQPDSPSSSSASR